MWKNLKIVPSLEGVYTEAGALPNEMGSIPLILHKESYRKKSVLIQIMNHLLCFNSWNL